MQKKYMELSQNSVMHVFEHFCECIEESDFTSVMNCILASLRNVGLVLYIVFVESWSRFNVSVANSRSFCALGMDRSWNL